MVKASIPELKSSALYNCDNLFKVSIILSLEEQTVAAYKENVGREKRDADTDPD